MDGDATRKAALNTLGRYKIERTLGLGPMGAVYEDWDSVTEQWVAIKTIEIQGIKGKFERLRFKLRVISQIHHANIVSVFDWGETADLAYIVMEFVDGRTLAEHDACERLALQDTVRVMQDVLAGLQYIHERGVLHRNIKPTNIILAQDGHAKLSFRRTVTRVPWSSPRHYVPWRPHRHHAIPSCSTVRE